MTVRRKRAMMVVKLQLEVEHPTTASAVEEEHSPTLAKAPALESAQNHLERLINPGIELSPTTVYTSERLSRPGTGVIESDSDVGP